MAHRLALRNLQKERLVVLLIAKSKNPVFTGFFVFCAFFDIFAKTQALSLPQTLDFFQK
jgi:hypothetical protein